MRDAIKSLSDEDAADHSEGTVAKNIEKQTAKLPSDTFLWLACGAAAGAVTFQIMRRDHIAILVGQLVPTILILGLYNKIVKVAGSD